MDLVLPPVGAATPLGRREGAPDEMEVTCVEGLELDEDARD